jgi:hypothetical protein
MPTVEERLASLEARLAAMSDIRNLIAELRGDMNARFIDVTGRFTELRDDMNGRFSDMNGRFIDINGRFTELRKDMNRRFDDVNSRLVVLDQKGDRHFTWMVSTQVALLLAVVGALATAYFR